MGGFALTKFKNRKPDLIRNKFFKLFGFATLGSLLTVIAGSLDGIISGNFLNQEALKAVQIVAPISTLMFFIGALCNTGIASRYFSILSKKEYKKAHILATNGIITTLLLGIISAVILLLIKGPFLNLFSSLGLPESVISYASDYYQWFVYSVTFIPTFLLLYQFVYLDCDIKIKFVTDVGQCVVKVILSFLLIQIMGINGLGLATLLSFAFAIFVVLIHFFKKTNSIKFAFGLNLKDLGFGIRLSIGNAIGNLSLSLVSFFLNILIVRFIGAQYLPVYTILTFTLSLGALVRRISTSMYPFMVSSFGSQNKIEFEHVLKLGKHYVLLFGITLSVIVAAFCWAIPYAYKIMPNNEIYIYSVIAVLLMTLSFVPSSFSRLIANYYTASQKPSIYPIIETINPLYCIGFCYLLGICFGIWGFIIGYISSNILTLITIAIILFVKNKSYVLFKRFDIDAVQYMTNFRIYNENEVDQSINEIKTFLLENNIDENKVNVLSVAIKEMSNVLKQYNKRNIINSITFSITDDQILITNKNNGDYITPEQKKAEFFAIENHPAFSSIYVEEDYEIYIISSFNCVSLKTSKN